MGDRPLPGNTENLNEMAISRSSSPVIPARITVHVARVIGYQSHPVTRTARDATITADHREGI